MMMDYQRIYIYQAYDSTVATLADSKEEAFEKLKPDIEFFDVPDIEDMKTLDEFLTTLLDPPPVVRSGAALTAIKPFCEYTQEDIDKGYLAVLAGASAKLEKPITSVTIIDNGLRISTPDGKTIVKIPIPPLEKHSSENVGG